jgi:TRAP-type C4-dicarboxylate transport system substrate-binding protein
MKTSSLSLVCVVLLVALLAVGFTAPAAAQSGKVRELTFSTYTPTTHHVTKVLEDFCKEVERATGGQVKIVLYAGGTMTKPPQILDGVIKGVSDFGYSVNGYTPGRFPLMEVTDLPIPVATSEKMSQICLATCKKFQPKEFSQLKVLGFLNMAGGHIASNKPISKFADLSGQLLRCNGNEVEIVKAFGATPVAMSMDQAYEALQKGVVDGTIADYAAVQSYKLGEVLKNHLEYFVHKATAWYGMNLNTYNSLTPAQQKIITDLGEKYTTLLGQSRDAEYKRGRDYLVDLKRSFFKVPPEEEQKWSTAFAPLLQQYIKEKTAMGLPAKEAVDFVLAAVK